MKFWESLKNKQAGLAVQTGRQNTHPFDALESYFPLGRGEYRLYESLREGIPLIDAALDRIVRLIGTFILTSEDPVVERTLGQFAQEVHTLGGAQGLGRFVEGYLNDLLTYGNAAGEMLPGVAGEGIRGLYNAPLENLLVKGRENPIHPDFWVRGENGSFVPATAPEDILYTPLRPASGSWEGVSLLRGLPFVSDILLKIYRSVGNNFQRAANVRYAITYKPGGNPIDHVHAGEIAQTLADEWSATMAGDKNGQVRDFVAVGDVDIRVIGADSQIPDTTAPVRQMLEQLVAKLGVPPFLLGLHWSSTERMSSQQADMLTSELDYYREVMTPTIARICRRHLNLLGLGGRFEVKWENINLQDEVELANARLLRLQADQLEQQLKGGQ